MKSLAIALLAAFAAPAFAAGALAPDPIVIDLREHLAAADEARLQGDAWKRWADDYSRDMRTSMNSLFANRVVSHQLVKGAPYSARIVTELNQPLTDGNVISHRHEGMVYRDAEGRTREETLADGKRTSVVINDPVDNKHWVLMPDFKRAIESPGRKVKEARVKNKQVVKVDGRQIRIEDGSVFVDGKEVTDTVVVKSKSGKEIRVENGKVTIDGKEVAEAGADGHRHVIVRTIDLPEGRREEVRVQVVRPGEAFELPPVAPPAPPTPPAPPDPPALAPPPPVPPVPPIPGVQTMRFESPARLGKGVTTSLGTKDIEGVKAEGKQTTWTIPAGEIGNRSPIGITSESWYSPELKVTVYARYNDPRTGESIYRLAGLKRGEPAPDLFKVPADYEVRARGK
jgi:YD repeat-containing protein